MNISFIILAASFAPLMLILHVWKKDYLQPEPLKEIGKAFGWGCVVALVCLIIETAITLFPFLSDTPITFVSALKTAFCVAAIPEEGIKLLFLWIFLRKDKYFDEHVDGIVYAVAISMGFAAMENVGFLVNDLDNWKLTAIARSVSAVPGHYMFAVAMGYFFSLAHFKKSAKYYILSFVIPVFIHGLYDSVVFMLRIEQQYVLLLFTLFVALMIFFLVKSSRAITNHLLKDVVNNKPTNDIQQ